MEITIENGYKKVLPTDGKVLTDGAIYSESLYMPIDADVSVWSEVDPPQEEE